MRGAGKGLQHLVLIYRRELYRRFKETAPMTIRSKTAVVGVSDTALTQSPGLMHLLEAGQAQ